MKTHETIRLLQKAAFCTRTLGLVMACPFYELPYSVTVVIVLYSRWQKLICSSWITVTTRVWLYTVCNTFLARDMSLLNDTLTNGQGRWSLHYHKDPSGPVFPVKSCIFMWSLFFRTRMYSGSLLRVITLFRLSNVQIQAQCWYLLLKSLVYQSTDKCISLRKKHSF